MEWFDLWRIELGKLKCFPTWLINLKPRPVHYKAAAEVVKNLKCYSVLCQIYQIFIKIIFQICRNEWSSLSSVIWNHLHSAVQFFKVKFKVSSLWSLCCPLNPGYSGCWRWRSNLKEKLDYIHNGKQEMVSFICDIVCIIL